MIPWWQLASVANALMAIGLYLWSGDEIVRMDGQSEYSPGHRTDLALRTVSVGRACLSVYTSACLMYMALTRLPGIHWPPIGDRLFPWT